MKRSMKLFNTVLQNKHLEMKSDLFRALIKARIQKKNQL